ncbi:MAG: hypothetical protein GXO83_06525 [Chlorobi bacterium]|nr:hypothetical protein [Chlorobiota bacterium]
MKELFIVRHGKSDWNHPEIKDIDRPLKVRGVVDAERMGAYIKSNYTLPGICYTSPACRATHTALIFMRCMNIETSRLQILNSIYLASFNDLKELVKMFPEKVDSAMLVGHNPGITDLANSYIHNRIQNIPTSGFVHLVFESGTWKGTSYKVLSDFTFHFPKEFYA